MSENYNPYFINKIKNIKKKNKIYFTKYNNKNEIKDSSFIFKEKIYFEKILTLLYYSI